MDALRLFGALWFLPVFPLSGVFVQLLGRRLRPYWLRAVAYLAWPVIGSILIMGLEVPDGIRGWAVASSILYALRLLSTRDLDAWLAYLGASAFALLWLPATAHATAWLAALALGLPLAGLALFSQVLERRFGAAYAGLYGGMHLRQPRLAGLLTLLLLAAVATPVFPGFFVMTGIALGSAPAWSAALLLSWVLWTWAAALLLQGFMFGPARAETSPDAHGVEFYGFVLALAASVVGGLLLIHPLLWGG